MNYGMELRARLDRNPNDILPFIGVYDVFSASIAARYYQGIFVSGFSFAASFYGLPDIGFISWSDIVQFVQRVRALLPKHYILVDMDDGYCDTEVACHVTTLLERSGASAIILEDQKRPRRCGHYNDKQLLELDAFMEKLNRVLATRQDLFVVARTDASDPEEIFKRVRAFDAAGADAILADGLTDLNLLKEMSRITTRPLVFNQLAGGKSPPCTLETLKEHGVSLVNYSTPCLFAAQDAIERSLIELSSNGGLVGTSPTAKVNLAACSNVLQENLIRRDAMDLGPLRDPAAGVVHTLPRAHSS
jgi:2-methylisocitrate lyase-like PEP mutase family enzyme